MGAYKRQLIEQLECGSIESTDMEEYMDVSVESPKPLTGWTRGPVGEANRELLAEAIDVTTETGLTPRQLAEQRAELIGVLEAILAADDNVHITTAWWEIDSARQVLAKCQP